MHILVENQICVCEVRMYDNRDFMFKQACLFTVLGG